MLNEGPDYNFKKATDFALVTKKMPLLQMITGNTTKPSRLPSVLCKKYIQKI